MKNLSTKELNYLNDYLSWELLAAKKCYQYACQQNDTKYWQVFDDAAHTHQNNYIRLLNYVNQINSSQGGEIH